MLHTGTRSPLSGNGSVQGRCGHRPCTTTKKQLYLASYARLFTTSVQAGMQQPKPEDALLQLNDNVLTTCQYCRHHTSRMQDSHSTPPRQKRSCINLQGRCPHPQCGMRKDGTLSKLELERINVIEWPSQIPPEQRLQMGRNPRAHQRYTSYKYKYLADTERTLSKCYICFGGPGTCNCTTASVSGNTVHGHTANKPPQHLGGAEWGCACTQRGGSST